MTHPLTDDIRNQLAEVRKDIKSEYMCARGGDCKDGSFNCETCLDACPTEGYHAGVISEVMRQCRNMFEGAERYAVNECGLSDMAVEMYRKAYNELECHL